MKKLILTALTAAAVASAPAQARDGKKHDREDFYDYGEYAKVISARPIYQQVRVSAPRQECREERVVYREPSYRNNDGAALFGAILGGVAGHQFGGGSGKSVATAAGALIGASVASNRSSVSRHTERVAYEQHCNTYDDYYTEDRIEGYDVTYRYNGRTYHTRTPYDPGSRIQVRVDVSPVRSY